MNLVIAASRLWDSRLPAEVARRTGHECHLVTQPEELTAERLAALAPRYVLFPHWSHRIPREIHEAFECVIFHMTDLPFGRGGSPLQNLIAREIYETKICALRCVEEMDAGPVYLRRPLSLHGSAQEIYLRATGIVQDMMVELVNTSPPAIPQEGKPVLFRRRTPAEGDLASLDRLEEVFDHIRMLDADGYPPAFMDIGRFRLEFRRASYRGESICADVIITERP